MEKFKDISLKITECIPSTYKWEMDETFDASLVLIEKNDIEPVKEGLSKAFENQWDSSSIKKAPKTEKELSKFFSGIQKGQILFTISDDDIIFFGAWWPWGDYSKVSLRIGFFSLEKDLTRDEIKQNLTEWFSI